MCNIGSNGGGKSSDGTNGNGGGSSVELLTVDIGNDGPSGCGVAPMAVENE